MEEAIVAQIISAKFLSEVLSDDIEEIDDLTTEYIAELRQRLVVLLQALEKLSASRNFKTVYNKISPEFQEDFYDSVNLLKHYEIKCSNVLMESKSNTNLYKWEKDEYFA